MSLKHSKLSIAHRIHHHCFLALLFAFPDSTSAANQCHSDQKQMLHQGAIAFGGHTVLGQTFIPSAPGHRVCRVKVIVNKNFAGV